ncbi:MAG: hypothetical protein AB1744_12570, partial [Candidatus Zixiibacteriota bacterium]
DHSSVRLLSVLVAVLDSLGEPLNPNQLFDRIGFRVSGASVTYQPFVELWHGAALFRLDTNGLLLNPGDSISVQLIADIEADAPFDYYLLEVATEDALSWRDATDTSRNPGFVLSAGCNVSFPFAAGPTEIFLPAGRPGITPQTLPVQIAFPGQIELTVFKASLTYESPTAQGDLSINGLRGQILRRTADGLLPATGGDVFAAVRLTLDGQTVAGDTTLAGDSVVLVLEGDYSISTSSLTGLTLNCDLDSDAAPGNYLIRFNDSSFMDIADKNLSTRIYPMLTTGSYPLTTAEISVTMAGLEHSFTNYPNPFIPLRDEVTTIAFVLAEDAHIDLEIFSITGEAVKEIVMNAFRTAGSHQETWSGINDVGRPVISGTYFCRITARYSSGRVESFRRKIAVIR